jgi:hypothetical protein
MKPQAIDPVVMVGVRATTRRMGAVWLIFVRGELAYA